MFETNKRQLLIGCFTPYQRSDIVNYRLIQFKDTIAQSRAYFAIFKLPVIVFTALLGFMLEFIIELPFMVLCMLDRNERRTEDSASEAGSQKDQ